MRASVPTTNFRQAAGRGAGENGLAGTAAAITTTFYYATGFPGVRPA